MDIYAIVVLDAGAPHAGGRLREIEWRKNAAKTLLPEEILNSGAASGENVRFQGADVGELFTPASS